MIKYLSVTILAILLTFFGLRWLRSISVVNNATELTTEHFLITYRGVYAAEAEEIANALEENYERIRNDLNDPDHNTIRVFVHAGQTDFNDATGLPNSTANGTSRGPDEFHLIWTNWFNSIFPNDPIKTALHEFTHCVQLNILIKEAKKEWGNSQDFDKKSEEKFIKEYPQWFWEAICDYEAGVVNTISVKYGIRRQLSLNDLNTSNQIYNVGYTIIEYIVEKWGKDKLPLLIISYVDIETVLGLNESNFERGWIDFVNEKY
jgi:hypothetical protein